MTTLGWQAIEAEVLRRIHARDWPPGSAIPHEAELAREFGVARATVNRALQSLADGGWLDRRRKAGTRVAEHPVRKARLSIPILRTEIEEAGFSYGYRLLDLAETALPAAIAADLTLPAEQPLLHVTALHLAGGRPWAHEDRWINAAAVPAIRDVDLGRMNANEWLVRHAPFTHGGLAIGAISATPEVAEALSCAPATALVTLDRDTWNGTEPITRVRQCFAPGHLIRMTL
jgi:GntR family transcriptional regulator, histidine utilization repressor